MILHGTATGPFLLAWEIQPYMLLALVLLAGGYYLGLRRIERFGVRKLPPSRPVYFYAGLIAFTVAIAGPVEAYNENSFALHMGQHVTMMLIAAPLVVLGRPVHVALWALAPQSSGAIIGPILRRRWVRVLLIVFNNPLVALLIVNVNLVLWHLPAFYVAALENTLVHELEHVLFFGTSLVFWWVIVDPIPRHHRASPEVSILMLFVSGTVGGLLALYLIFSPEVLYPFYLDAETVWGLSQYTDQRVGGLVMLIAGTVVYFGATFLLIAKNYGSTAPDGAPVDFEPVQRERLIEPRLLND